jgi:uncharacterized repeat protein (TIGR01451 family)
MRSVLVSAAALLALAATAPSTSAQMADGQGTDRFVTIAARECPSYTDITANRARNDIQESLRDLGPDTPYVAGQSIDPAIEAASQPNCTPLPNWTFTLGRGYQSRAVSGPWGALSIVTNPYSQSIVTQAQVPLLDYQGRPTNDSIAGAVIIELTQDQANRAAQNNSLWIQGGTTTDPILNDQFPGEYGFGALRCAIDNLNGDNVEWIAYPSGTKHVFCFAYYVRPPPTSGTIVIRKEVSEPPGADQSFEFTGNLSFNEDGRFTLNVQDGNPAQARFYRAATTGPSGTGVPWTVREVVPPGWTLTDLSCESPGPSTEVIAGPEVVINLAADDTVTCTFTNAFRVPAGRLFLAKITLGGTGIFDFDVFPVGGGDRLEARAETSSPGVPVLARPAPLEVSPGRYRIEEELPESRRGEWRLSRVFCGGLRTRRSDTDSAIVEVEDQEGSGCLFVNRFIPSGGLVIDKATTGGVGTFDFTIWPVGDPETVFHKTATTTEPLTLTRARGDRTRNIQLGRYVIQEVGPHSDDGEWALRLVVCDGQVIPATEGRVMVRLTENNPVKRCGFLNVFTPDPPAPDPGPGPGPGPEPPGPNPAPHLPDPDLVITKRPDRRVAAAGERIRYTVTVRNRGPVATEDVVLGEAPGPGEAFASVIGRGSNRCGRRVVLRRNAVICRLGPLAAGARRTLRFETRVTSAAPRVIANVAVVGSATPETTAANNVAAARVRRVGRPAGVTG